VIKFNVKSDLANDASKLDVLTRLQITFYFNFFVFCNFFKWCLMIVFLQYEKELTYWMHILNSIQLIFKNQKVIVLIFLIKKTVDEMIK